LRKDASVRVEFETEERLWIGGKLVLRKGKYGDAPFA